MWWSLPKNLGLLGLDPQFTCILGWVYPTMGGPRNGFIDYWWGCVVLALNPTNLGSTKMMNTWSSPLPKIQTRFLNSLDMAFFTITCVSWSIIYILPLVGLSWWGDLRHVCGSLRIISLTRGDPPPIVDMNFL